jgi:hypothetical protein
MPWQFTCKADAPSEACERMCRAHAVDGPGVHGAAAKLATCMKLRPRVAADADMPRAVNRRRRDIHGDPSAPREAALVTAAVAHRAWSKPPFAHQATETLCVADDGGVGQRWQPLFAVDNDRKQAFRSSMMSNLKASVPTARPDPSQTVAQRSAGKGQYNSTSSYGSVAREPQTRPQCVLT